MNILFICQHNIFRSKAAESYFKKENRNKKVKASSAGLIKVNWLSKNEKRIISLQRKALGEKGIKINQKSRILSTSLIRKQDLIIIVANDIPDIFTGREYANRANVRIWKIKDVIPRNYSKKNLISTIDSIMKRVDVLVKELKNVK